MEIRWLEDFITLARTRHFSRAADERHVTQPTFSRRIKLLEEEMGAVLINRQSLPLSLTPAGEEFLGLCEQVTQRVVATRERLSRLADTQANQLRLAAPQSLLSCFLPDWRDSLALEPPLQPYLRATGWLVGDYFQALSHGECDLALCYWPRLVEPPSIDRQGCEQRWVSEECLVPVTVPNADGTPRFCLETSHRDALPLIAYHHRGLLHAAIGAHLAGLNRVPKFHVLSEGIQSSNIRELVGLGYGLGWLPLRVVAPALRAGELVAAGDARWQVPLDILLFRHPEHRHPALDALWQQLPETHPIA
ncbi:LysR family transcriptional regulator [Halomonas campisalis]|uniref:LysR family transcriptional regulator n=1 Tax=Billgrantia campisalis TaxID=74661 RepID=A0ABS9P5S1_9GAMM|nr:LysR family transcriptional regulator [Halomonas campisalis]MCG6657113.1 LysR family transcriptional regulator [Halomonas campisalis]MDR5862298.1 LysR family transcriptional regulator [Halomonas campisalis]